MATAKIVNYTEEQTAKIKADYAAGITVGTIAASIGKSVRSVIAKLTREGVYKAKEYKTKNGATVVKKEALVESIAKELNVNSEKLNGLEKTNKIGLQLILDALKLAAE